MASNVEKVDGSKSVAKGNIAEKKILELVKTFSDVTYAVRDTFNAKYDIFYKLKGDPEDINQVRGIQVKALCRQKDSDMFCINDINGYPDGTLIVCCDPESTLGLLFIADKETELVRSSATINGRSRFSKLLAPWNIFAQNLSDHLKLTNVVDRLTTMPPLILLEYKMTLRFIEYCKSHGFKYELSDDASSVTDIIVEGKKMQLKYISDTGENESNKYIHSYGMSLHRACDGVKGPYHLGDNDFYVAEIGNYHGHFLILSEALLIEKGVIKTDTQPGKVGINVFPFDYLDDPKTDNTNPLRGNWTCNRNLWYDNSKRYPFESPPETGKQQVELVKRFMELHTTPAQELLDYCNTLAGVAKKMVDKNTFVIFRPDFMEKFNNWVQTINPNHKISRTTDVPILIKAAGIKFETFKTCRDYISDRAIGGHRWK